MGDVISLEQYRKRLARRTQSAAKAAAKAAADGPKKPAAKLPRPKNGPDGKRKLSLELPAGEPPKKKT